MGNKPSSNDASASEQLNTSANSSSSASRTSASSSGTSNSSSNPKPSYYQMVKQGYQELVNAIIRPPRCQYEVTQLGPKSFDFCGKTIIRSDFTLINPKGEKIVVSHWEPDEKSRPNPVLPCLIYMHGNSSSRLEALPQLSLVLHIGATLLTFDFAGSGQSDGEYVSLGAFERDDLQCVIEHLREAGRTSTIALWGRSMGAATALLHGERDPSIAGMVLDSAFTDLESLAEELVERGRQHGLYAPGFVVSIAIRFIRSSVQKSAGFDIKDLSPITHADKCFIPALFIAAADDKFVPPHHSQRIYEKYAGDKNIIIVEGDHNSLRPRFMQDSVTIFLHNTLRVPEEWIIESGAKYVGYLPWANQRYKKQASVSKAKQPNAYTESGALVAQDGETPQDMGFGMTGERQAEIQSRLFQMAGQGKATTPTDTKISRNSPLRKHSRKNNETGDEIPNDSQYDEAEEEYSEPILDDMDPAWHEHIGSFEEGVLEGDWTCETCTLFNSEATEFCMACGLPRF